MKIINIKGILNSCIQAQTYSQCLSCKAPCSMSPKDCKGLQMMCSLFLFCFLSPCAGSKLSYSNSLIPNPANATVNQILFLNFQNDCFFFLAYIILATILAILAKIYFFWPQNLS